MKPEMALLGTLIGQTEALNLKPLHVAEAIQYRKPDRGARQ